MVDSTGAVMFWAARIEWRKDTGSADIGEYRRDRGRRDATVRSRSTTTAPFRHGCTSSRGAVESII